MNLPNMKTAKIRTKKKTETIYVEDLGITNLFSNSKYYLRTYGCQMNVHDSEEIKARVEALGFTSVSDIKECDLIILNTCAIRENVHDKVFGFLGKCKNLKKSNPNLMIILCGCMAQEESIALKIKEEYSFIDIVIGTHNINELTEILKNKKKEQLINVYSYEGKIFENIPYKRDSKISAWVNIMYGCNRFCTYCIVPFTRGKERSRLPINIIKEIEELINNGYKEIILLGQNVNAYGHDLEQKINFAGLLKLVSETGISSIRFMTSHPWDFTDELIEVIKTKENIIKHIHLPVQSGSTKILKLMGRKYSKEDYLNLHKKIKEEIPNVSITTDIIVGFPGEEEEDFEETLDVVRQCRFDGAFTFIYSPREATPAAKMKDDISVSTKKARLQKLNELIKSNIKP